MVLDGDGVGALVLEYDQPNTFDFLQSSLFSMVHSIGSNSLTSALLVVGKVTAVTPGCDNS